MMTTFIGYALFYLFMLGGIAVIPLGLPGQFAVPTAVLIFILVAGADTLPWWVFFVVLGLAILAELIEAIAGFLGAGKAKGSLWSAFSAFFGGLIGALIGTAVLPLVGSILGALAGTFVAAYAVEFYLTKTQQSAHKVAKGALIGRIIGSFTKVILGVIMVVLITVIIFGM